MTRVLCSVEDRGNRLLLDGGQAAVAGEEGGPGEGKLGFDLGSFENDEPTVRAIRVAGEG
ncbi:MAG: hypothetical protein V9H69_27080 [Anaerolineae bacterium]